MRLCNKILISFLAVCFSFFAAAQAVYPDFQDGWAYVKVKDTSSAILSLSNPPAGMQDVINNYGISSIEQAFNTTDTSLGKIYHFNFSAAAAVEDMIADVQALSYIEYGEKMPIIETTHIPNDLHAEQWYLTKINAQGAWDFSKGDPSVVVAVVDNGVLLNHEDILPNIWKNNLEINGLPGIDDDINGYVDDFYGWDMAENDNDVNPPVTTKLSFSHGTHVAGIASAATNNGKGVASLGYSTHIMTLKCSPDTSEGKQLYNVYNGIIYAADNGADVINMSFGGTGKSSTHESVINYAHNLGAVLIAAAGNSDTSAPFYPAAYPHVIAVGATNELDQKAGFSNYGNYIDVMAPGTNIYNTLATGTTNYGSLSGTSMAAPVVSGLAALLLSYDPALSTQDVEFYIKAGAEDIDLLNPDYIGQLGEGRINAYQSFVQLTGVTEAKIRSSEKVVIYPNPAEGAVFVLLPEGNHIEHKFFLYNSLGEKVQEHSVSGSSSQITVESLPKGVYFYTLGSYRGKLIIH